MNYRGKRVLITGGSQGIGLAVAHKFHALGADVVLLARNPDKLSLAAEAIGARPGGSVATLSLDVTDANAVEAALGNGRSGPVDVLVNAAGLARPTYFELVGPAQFDRIVRTNLYGPYHLCRSLLAEMRKSRGYIVNVSSVAGFIGVFGYTDYCASKFGLIGFSEALREEVKRDGVRVSVLCPPDTDTPGMEEENRTKPRETLAISAKAKLLSPEQVAAELLRGMRRERFLIVPGTDGKLSLWAKRLFPGVVHRIMQQTIRKALP